MSIMSIAPMNGPVTLVFLSPALFSSSRLFPLSSRLTIFSGPLIGGFVFQYLGWRWDSYIVMIIAGVAIVCLFTVKETYAPTILKNKAAKRRKETDDERYWCRYDEHVSLLTLLKSNLSRPFVLAATEPILWFFNIW